MFPRWRHVFDLLWPAASAWESSVRSDRSSPPISVDGQPMVAILDAECELLALVPDREALTDGRRLPELVAEVLSLVAEVPRYLEDAGDELEDEEVTAVFTTASPRALEALRAALDREDRARIGRLGGCRPESHETALARARVRRLERLLGAAAEGQAFVAAATLERQLAEAELALMDVLADQAGQHEVTT